LTNQNGNISINSTNNTNGRQNKNETEKSKKKKIETYLIKERGTKIIFFFFLFNNIFNLNKYLDNHVF